MEKRLLSIDEAVEYLGIKKNTMRAWCCQKKIPYYKMGHLVKFDKAELNAWIDGQKVDVVDDVDAVDLKTYNKGH